MADRLSLQISDLLALISRQPMVWQIKPEWVCLTDGMYDRIQMVLVGKVQLVMTEQRGAHLYLLLVEINFLWPLKYDIFSWSCTGVLWNLTD